MTSFGNRELENWYFCNAFTLLVARLEALKWHCVRMIGPQQFFPVITQRPSFECSSYEKRLFLVT